MSEPGAKAEGEVATQYSVIQPSLKDGNSSIYQTSLPSSSLTDHTFSISRTLSSNNHKGCQILFEDDGNEGTLHLSPPPNSSYSLTIFPFMEEGRDGEEGDSTIYLGKEGWRVSIGISSQV